MKDHPILIVVLLILLTGCAALPHPSPEESLRARVEGLMQAKVDGKWDVVYGFFESSFRKTMSKEKYSNVPRGISFENFTIETIEILSSGKEATVNVKSDISMQGFTFKGAPEKQRWVKEGRQWFLKAKPRTHPFAPQKK
jgi:hypothetical protein